jgi:hypothetical protein
VISAGPWGTTGALDDVLDGVELLVVDRELEDVEGLGDVEVPLELLDGLSDGDEVHPVSTTSAAVRVARAAVIDARGGRMSGR